MSNTYATTAELEARFDGDLEMSFLTDNEAAGSADSAVLTEVLDDAAGEFDSYALIQYDTPVDVSTDTILAARIKSVVLDLACWKLMVRSDRVSEVKQASYEAALAWLKDLAAGNVALPSDDPLPDSDLRATVSAWGTASTGSSSKRLNTRATHERL